MKKFHNIIKKSKILPLAITPMINNKLTSSSFLSSAKIRNQMLRSEEILTLNEILEVGSLFYGSKDLLSLYDMNPYSFYEKGVRLLGRTSIECTIDAQSTQIAHSIKNLKDDFFQDKEIILLDLFAGSGNPLYHINKKINPLESIGIESNKKIYNLTNSNLRTIKSNSKLYFGNAFEVIKKLRLPQRIPIFVFVDPPWGKALSPKGELDLMNTNPSIHKIITNVKKAFPQNPLIFIIKTYEKMVDSSVKSIINQFSYSSIELIAAMNDRLNIGMMVCTNELNKTHLNQNVSYFLPQLVA